MKRKEALVLGHTTLAVSDLCEAVRVLVNVYDRVRADDSLVRAELLMECLSLPAPLADCPLCDVLPPVKRARKKK